MPLHVEHRPTTLDEVVGNESVIQSLKTVLSRKKDRTHSFLFTGQSGCGKTTMVRILKNEFGCSNSDFYNYNSANLRGIDVVRDIIDNCQFAPMDGDVKFFALEEFHQVTGPAQEALLVILEQPPEHVYFALSTTEPGKLKATIKRRCHTSEMKPLLLPQILKLLESVLEKEGVSEFPDDVLVKIADVCNGSPGIALNLLDSVIDVANDETAFQVIEDAAVSEANIAQIAQVLIAGNGQWQSIALMIKGLSGEPESLRYAFLGWFNKALLNKGTDRVYDILDMFRESIMYSGAGGLTGAIYLAWKASLQK